MQIIPSKGYVLLRPIEKQREVGSFILTEDSAEAPQVAVVVSTGEGAPYNTGDKLIYRSYTTTDIKLNDEVHYLVNIEDILGKVIND